MKKIYLMFFVILAFSASCTFNIGTPDNTAKSPTTNPANATNTTTPVAENKNTSVPAENNQKESAVSIDTFTDFPPEIDGCSCYLSSSQSEFKGSKYIYADNYEDTAFVKINGVMTKFKRVEEKEVSKNQVIKKFDNKDYEIVVDLTKSGINGPFPQKRTIKLTKKGGQTITKDVNGECGC